MHNAFFILRNYFYAILFLPNNDKNKSVTLTNVITLGNTDTEEMLRIPKMMARTRKTGANFSI